MKTLKSVIFLISIFIYSNTSGQSIEVVLAPSASGADSIGTAAIECRYEYSWLKDTTARMSETGELVSGDSTDVVRGMMILQCGGGVSKFYSYDKFYIDSLYFSDIDKYKGIDKLSRVKNTFTVYKNFPEAGKMTLTDAVGADNYMVVEDIPDFGWVVCDEWKEIAGYRARKATSTFRGRDYVAWFAPELPLTEGPWKFSGLPGLIMEVRDAANQYRYELKGIVLKDATVYMPDLNYLKTDLEKYLRVLRRYNENPMQFLLDIDMGMIQQVVVSKPDGPSGEFKIMYDFPEII